MATMVSLCYEMSNESSPPLVNATIQWENSSNEICPFHFQRHRQNFFLSMIILNSLVAFIAVLLNLLVLIVFAKKRSLRTPSNLLVLALSTSDFGIAVFSQPIFCVWLYANFACKEQLIHTFGTIFYNSFLLLAFVSFGTLTAISADRFFAIHLHLRYKELVTTRRYVMGFVIIWLTNFAFLICRSLINNYNTIIFDLMELLILLALNFYFFFKISQAINKHSQQIQAQQNSLQHSLDIPRYRRSIKTMYYVVGPFVFWYILFIGSLMAVRISREEINQRMCILLTVTPTLLMLNGVLNPMIYCIRNRDIRRAVFAFLHVK